MYTVFEDLREAAEEAGHISGDGTGISEEVWEKDNIESLRDSRYLEILLGNGRNPCMTW